MNNIMACALLSQYSREYPIAYQQPLEINENEIARGNSCSFLSICKTTCKIGAIGIGFFGLVVEIIGMGASLIGLVMCISDNKTVVDIGSKVVLVGLPVGVGACCVGLCGFITALYIDRIK